MDTDRVLHEAAFLGRPHLEERKFSRRHVLVQGLAFGSVSLWACSDGSSPSSDADAATLDAADDRGADAGAGDRTGWATGGTAAMTGEYPDPFPSAATACVLLTSVTEGPCTEAADRERKDISEGYTGLPVRLALRVVDLSCAPVSGAKVKVWHTQIAGSYSGDTPNPNMCLESASEAEKHYCRGVQTTDALGRVDFDTCFPGWYRGRTIHIHYTITLGDRAFTSQLVFDQQLVDQVFREHPEYSPYGLPDTTNASDNVVGGQDLASFTAAATRMDDGSLLATKDLVLAT